MVILRFAIEHGAGFHLLEPNGVEVCRLQYTGIDTSARALDKADQWMFRCREAIGPVVLGDCFEVYHKKEIKAGASGEAPAD